MTHKQIKSLLAEIEHEMRQLDLWSAMPPDPDALSSHLPFCCDTLPFEGWLQYLFLPRMHALIDGNQPLPENCEILPMATEAFKKEASLAIPLLLRIAEIDRVLSNNS
jgi:dTDP-4-dehydrorhamnose 3,5-epimerase